VWQRPVFTAGDAAPSEPWTTTSLGPAASRRLCQPGVRAEATPTPDSPGPYLVAVNVPVSRLGMSRVNVQEPWIEDPVSFPSTLKP